MTTGNSNPEIFSDPPECVITGESISCPFIRRMSKITVRSAEPMGWHTHESFELLFVTKGEVSYELKDRKPIRVSGGSFLIIPPGVLHCALNHVRTPVSLLGVLCQSHWENFQDLTIFQKSDLMEMSEVFKRSALTGRQCDSDLSGSVDRLKSLFKTCTKESQIDPLVQCKLRAELCALIANVVLNLSQPHPTDSNQIMEKLISYIEAHSAEPLQISDLVCYSGFSRSHLFNLFSEGAGMTPNDYLLRCRINHACDLLRQTDHTVTQIALDVGFSSSQYFSQVFKRYTGVSPHSYRKQHQS